jgi:14-3-3 protein epsilon
MDTPEDLFFCTDALLQASRFQEAIFFIEKLVAVKQSLASEDCILFEKVFKLAIHPIQRSLIALSEFHALAVASGRITEADVVLRYRERAKSELRVVCQRAIVLLKDVLLPNSQSIKATVFYLKQMGDYWRYLAEHEVGSDHVTALVESEENYKRALSIADGELLKSDPLRLALILHYGLLLVHHMRLQDQAAVILTQARTDAGIDLEQLSPSEHNEALELLSIIQANLGIWLDDDESLPNEEEV